MRRLAVLVVLGLLMLPGAARPATHHLIKQDILEAVADEKAALALLDGSPLDWDKAHEKIVHSHTLLVDALAAVQHGATHGDIHPNDASLIEGALRSAAGDDQAASELLKHGKEKFTASELRRALAAKHKALLQVSQIDEGTAKRCVVTKPFQIFAIPEGFSGSFSDVFPHGIPKCAKEIKVGFIDMATGHAPAPAAFPGQTWSSQVKGFRADGKFDVHVTLSGTGFGQPDANAKNWTVVVSYDC